MTDQEKFEHLIMLLAEYSETEDLELNNEITLFEDAIEHTGKGAAYFGTARSDWSRIEIIRPEYIPPTYVCKHTKFYAEYYDGCQAPFTVCRWSGDFTELETILSSISVRLYEMYKNRIGDQKG